MFNNAARVSIYNSNLISADTTHNHIHIDQDPLEPLKRHVIHGALFDSAERYDPPKCHPETRIAVIDNIKTWARGKHDSNPILWLRGAAGAGKSAIAQTLSERWSAKDLLAASFFFSRTAAGRNQSKHFIATLAYQVAHTIPMTRRYIERAISKDWRLFDKSLQYQIMVLIINPLMAPYAGTLSTKVVVVDGLDECCMDYPNQDHEAQQREILEAITLAAQYPIALRFLIASRPERQIRQSFRQEPLYHLVSKITLDNSYNPDADVSLFLRFRFKQIRDEHGDMEQDWPSEETIHLLVAKSSGHFVYASTVVRYVSDPRADPQKRLGIILGLSIPDDKLQNPFAQLDVLYYYIMASIQPDSLMTVLRIFEILTHPDMVGSGQLFTGRTNFSPEFMSNLLFTSSKQIYYDLIDLHSILEIPHSRHAVDTPIRFMHASFGEFLSSRARSGPYYIEPAQARLNCNLYIAKHTIIAGAQAHEAIDYNTNYLRAILVRGLEGTMCPPSKELRFALHTLFGKGRRGYSANLESIGMPTIDRANRMRQRFSWQDQIVVLSYLQRCNIKEIEHSSRYRWLMDASLIGQKTRIQTLMVLSAIVLAIPRILRYALWRPCTPIVLFVIAVPTIVIVTLKFKVGFG